MIDTKQPEALITTHGQVPAIRRYKIVYHCDEWGERSLSPIGIYDDAGPWVRYEDHAAALCRLHAENEALRAQQPAPTVEGAIAQLKTALRDSKGWTQDYSDALIRDAIDRVEPAPQPAAPQGDVAAWLVLADGEPHHVTPGASDDAARLWAEEQTKCGAPYSFTFLPLCPPAAIDAALADKGAPT